MTCSPTLISSEQLRLEGHRDGQLKLCLNYVQGGSCLIDGNACVLGPRGSKARNKDLECPRHGLFDVWRTREGLVLLSDLAGPYEGVTDCYGLGISLDEATKVAQTRALKLRTRIVTTERKCHKCGARFWAREGFSENVTSGRAARYFCASCLKQTAEAELQEYCREIGTTEGEPGGDLRDWCG